jgi:uncharacterized GH25 family protein
MRFFEGIDFRTIGVKLGVTEDAAQKRASRATGKLREVLVGNGIRISALSLGTLLAAHSLQAAPPDLAPILAENIRHLHRSISSTKPVGIRRTLKLVVTAVIVMNFLIIGLFWQHSRSGTSLAIAGDLSAKQNDPSPAPTATRTIEPTSRVVTAGKQLFLKVVESGTTNQISNVALAIRISTEADGSTSQKSETDETGSARIIFPTDVGTDFHYQIRLSKEGYVDRYVSWSVYQKDSLDDIPSEYTATLTKGIRIGGFVRDPQGEPISGVTVTFSGRSPAGIPPRERNTVMSRYHKEVTDSNGHWQCTHAPADYLETSFELQHPEYQNASYEMTGGDHRTKEMQEIPPSEFIAGTAQMVMQRGMLLRGQVLDEAGKPVSNAKVVQGGQYNDKQSIHLTDPQGIFEFRNCASSIVKITILARGFAPFLKELLPQKDASVTPLQITSSLGIRGVIVDPSDTPISGAKAQVAFDDQQRRQELDWESKTDSNGSFVWDSSPNTKTRLTFSAPGFQRKTEELQPGQIPGRISLTPADPKIVHNYRVKIKVVDIETGGPVAGAEVSLREYANSDGYSPSLAGRTDLEGQMDLKLASDTTRFEFDVRADSYRPEIVPGLTVSNAPKTMTIQLTRGSSVEGSILLPDGEPAANAEVGLFIGDHTLMIGTRQFLYKNEAIVTDTDATGHFVFPPQNEVRSIVAIHPLGFAKLEAAEWKNGGTIQLQPFASIRGQCLINGKPIANASIALLGTDGSMIYDFQGFSTKTTETGAFIFTNVPPVLIQIALLTPVNGGIAHSHAQTFRMEPGLENLITFSIVGRPIRGRLKNPPSENIDWSSMRLSLRPATDSGEFPRIETSPSIPLKVSADGVFSNEAIAPGKYRLVLKTALNALRSQKAKPQTYYSARDILIPDGERELDLGKVDLSK